MIAIERISFQNREKKKCAFEIVNLQDFMSTRSHQHLSRNFRIDFWTFMYIAKGEGTHFIDFEPYQYKAGDIVIVQKNQVNRFLVNSEAEGYIIIINEAFVLEGQGLMLKCFLEFFEQTYRSPILSVDYSRSSTNRVLVELIYKEYIKDDNSFNEDLIRGLFQSFLFSLDEYLKESRTSMESAVFRIYNQFSQLVEANYTKIKSVEGYSKLMFVSKKTINNATRSVVGLSAKQFIINRIILEIKRYLCQGDLNNYEIADFLGFDEPANLTNFFKRYEKMTPTKFKEMLK